MILSAVLNKWARAKSQKLTKLYEIVGQGNL